MAERLRGYYPVIITPFKENGEVDEKSLRRLVEYNLKNGMHGFTPCGSCGEMQALTTEERLRVTEIVIDEVKGRVPVIGCGGASGTDLAIDICKKLEKLGVKGIMVQPPYYFLPTQEGLYKHYKMIAEAVSVPIWLYDNPGATKVNMSVEFIKKLAEIDTIQYIKISAGPDSVIEKAKQLREATDKITIMSGADHLFFYGASLGYLEGGVIGFPFVFPKDFVQMWDLIQAGKIEEARKIHLKYLELMVLSLVEVGGRTRYPYAFKKMLKWLGVIECDVVRGPMVPHDPYRMKLLEDAWKVLGLEMKA
jgi:4-hydroxy-tetrahydrodipicolinate synthase